MASNSRRPPEVRPELVELERHFREDDVEQLASPPPRQEVGTANDAAICRVVFVNAPDAFGKRGDRHRMGAGGMQHEVAAWEVAKLIGAADIVPVTVLAEVVDADGAVFNVLMQPILHPHEQDAIGVESFTDDDMWRAALFDTLIDQGDRGTHNWGHVYVGRHERPVLFDNEDAFTVGPPRRGSKFVSSVPQLPAEAYEVIRCFLENVEQCPVADLLTRDELDAVIARARALLPADDAAATPTGAGAASPSGESS